MACPFRGSAQGWNHRFEQFIQQAVEGLRCFHFGQEKFDAFEVALEIRGEFDDRFFRHKQTPPVRTQALRRRLMDWITLRASFTLPAATSSSPLDASSISSR
jgi:hypothetical protein